MRITGYLNQTGIHERRVAEDEFTNPIFGPPTTVRCRTVVKHKMNRKTRHENYIGLTEHLTEHPVAIGDKFNGEVLLAVEHFVDFDGTVIGYRSYPRPPAGFTN